jgi:hypothetical protein
MGRLEKVRWGKGEGGGIKKLKTACVPALRKCKGLVGEKGGRK